MALPPQPPPCPLPPPCPFVGCHLCCWHLQLRTESACALPPSPRQVGKLFLVDLAGSERLKKSKSTGLRASEAKSINLSLTTLASAHPH